MKNRLYNLFPVLILGLTSIVFQFISVREFQSVLYGNELVYGLIFAVWMTMSATGARIGNLITKSKKYKINIVLLQLFLSILPFFTIFFLRYLRFHVSGYGITLNIFEISVFIIILLTPFCVVSGALFTLYSKKLADDGYKLSYVYFYETSGSIAGGLLFSFIFIYFFNVFQSLSLLYAFNIAAIFILIISFDGKIILTQNELRKRKLILILPIFLIVLALIPFLFNFDVQTKQYLFKGQKILETEDTPYGNIVVTKTEEQINFFMDGMLLYSKGNPADAEESVHYAMAQIREHKNVLLISGGICGLVVEILKYNPFQIDYTEIDPELIRLGRKYTKFSNDKRINIINEDGRLFIKKTNRIYDAVIIYLPEPSTAQLNRYFTFEFFNELKSKMSDSSVITLSLPLTENYVSKEAADLNSSVYNTIKSIFRNVIIIPGGKNFYIGSDLPLRYNIGDLIDSARIENIYVNKYYYDAQSTKQRADNILKSINRGKKLNYDFYPVSYYQQLLYWMSYFNINFYMLIGILFIPFIIIFIRLKPIGTGLFAVGFTSIGAELIILFAFQFIFGNVYYMLSIIITAFMLGIAIGVNLFKNTNNIKKFISSQLLLAVYISLLPFVILLIKEISAYYLFSVIIFIILIIIGALFVGVQYSAATEEINSELLLRRKKTSLASSLASEAYSADLYGSALGAFAITTILLPLLGIMNLGLLLGLFNILIAIWIIISFRKR